MKKFGKDPCRRILSLVLAMVLVCVSLPMAASAATEAPGFYDVMPAKYYAGWVYALKDNGIINGIDAHHYAPEKNIDRASFVKLLATAAATEAELEGYKYMNLFSDVSSGAWFAKYANWGSEKGIVNGTTLPVLDEEGNILEPARFSPNKNITREEAAAMLYRFAKAFPDITNLDPVSNPVKPFADADKIDDWALEAAEALRLAGIFTGDDKGNLNPLSKLTRGQAATIIGRILRNVNEVPKDQIPVPPAPSVSGGVSENGWLKVSGTQLCNEDGDPVVLHGMSSHGIHWFEEFTGEQAIKNTAKFGANLFRVAMYTGENGYLSRPSEIEKKAVKAVDAALAQDMYVILDWHILSDGNPMDHVEEAKAFFTKMAKRYRDQPGVLYEICNEPNGNVDWTRDIKPYAEQLVKTIRAQSPKSVILIGTPTWSQDVDRAAANPVKGNNLMYSLHFYAGTHGQWLRDRAAKAMDDGLPIFVTEWGTSAADGSGGVYLDEAQKWLDFMNKRGISWANWSLCDKNETSAALKPGTSPTAVWTEKDLSESGKFVFNHFK